MTMSFTTRLRNKGEDELGEGLLAGEAESENADAEESARDSTLPMAPRRRGWVLMAIPSTRRDWEDHLATGDNPPPTLDAHATAVRDEVVSYASGSGCGRPSARRSRSPPDTRSRQGRQQGPGVLPLRRLLPRRRADCEERIGDRNPRVEALARDRAGLPRRLRHEIGSVTALKSKYEREPIVAGEMDVELSCISGGHIMAWDAQFHRCPSVARRPSHST